MFKSFAILLIAACFVAAEKTITLNGIYHPTNGNDLYQYAQSVRDQMNNVTVSDASFIFLPMGEYAVGALAGTPVPQPLILMLDTATKYFWFTTEKCELCFNPKFITIMSQTYKELGVPVTDIKYAFGKVTGSASGQEAKEIVGVLGYSVSELRVVGVHSQSGDVFKSIWVHGGLGLNYDSFKGERGYVSQLVQDKIVDKRIVGLFLAENDTEIKIGGFNGDKGKDIQYDPAKEYNGMFNVPIKSFNYSDVSAPSNYHTGVILMHSPFMLLPLDVATPIVNKISSKLGKPCHIDDFTSLVWCEVSSTSLSQFEGLVMTLESGKSFTIAPANYIDFGENNGQKYAVLRMLAVKDLTYVGIGTPFLKSVYTVLDRETDRVGFAQLKSFSNSAYGAFFALLLAGLMLIF